MIDGFDVAEDAIRRDYECLRCGAGWTGATHAEMVAERWMFYWLPAPDSEALRPSPRAARTQPLTGGQLIGLCAECSAGPRVLREIRAFLVESARAA